MATLALSTMIPTAYCHDRYRMMITTDLEAGIEVSCESEDQVYLTKERHVNPELVDYTFPFDDLTPAHLTKFFCTVRDEHNNVMMFVSWEPKYMEAGWRFPWLNDQREVRWVVNNGGAWLYMKGTKNADSLMQWILMAIWPHLQNTIKGTNS
ncbi:unnamed protein product [Calypogeia fissa]